MGVRNELQEGGLSMPPLRVYREETLPLFLSLLTSLNAILMLTWKIKKIYYALSSWVPALYLFSFSSGQRVKLLNYMLGQEPPPPSDLQVWLGLILYSYVRVSAWRMNYWMSKHLYVCRKCVFLSSSFKDIWYVILLCKVLILLCLKHYFKNYIHTGLAIVHSSNHFWEKVHSTFKRQKCVFKRTFLMKSLFQV